MAGSAVLDGFGSAINNTLFLIPFECSLCLHGGKCRRTGYTTPIQCLCPDGYDGSRCQLTELDFTIGGKDNSSTPGLATGIAVGVCFLMLIAVIAFFLWRKRRQLEKKHIEEEKQSNRMKKMSIEGLSIIGDRPTVKTQAIPVCIAIEEETSSQEQLKLSPDEHRSYTNPLNLQKNNNEKLGCYALA